MSNDKPTVEFRKVTVLPNGQKVVPLKVDPELAKIMPMTHADILAQPPAPLEHVIHPWLPTQGIGFIFAATGLGKSLFAMNLAYAVAIGGNYLKYSCPKPRKILYIDGEMSYHDIYSRFMLIVSQQGENKYFPDNWNILTPDKVHPFKLPKISTP